MKPVPTGVPSPWKTRTWGPPPGPAPTMISSSSSPSTLPTATLTPPGNPDVNGKRLVSVATPSAVNALIRVTSPGPVPTTITGPPDGAGAARVAGTGPTIMIA